MERATDYSQFLSMAKELEITPTIRGKHMSYLLEGAGRAVRDNSLSDTDTFTYAGICARLSDNAQEQKYLRKTITGILRSATGMADFADKLKTAGIETKVKNRPSRYCTGPRRWMVHGFPKMPSVPNSPVKELSMR